MGYVRCPQPSPPHPLSRKNIVFHQDQCALRCAAFAGPAGPTFSFLPFPSFSQRFLSEWKQCWFSPAWGSPLPLSLPTNGSHGSNRAGNPFRWWSLPYPGLKIENRAVHGLFPVPDTLFLTFPYGERRGCSRIWAVPVLLDSPTTAPHGSNRAGNPFRWCRSPTWSQKPHTGSHKAKFDSHRRFLVRFGSGKAAKSRSSL